MDQVFSPAVFPAVLASVALVSVLGGTFKLFFWSESRVEKIAGRIAKPIAAQMMSTALKSAEFEAAVSRIAEAAFKARQEFVDDIKARADSQSQSIVSAHRRIDELQDRIVALISRERTEK